MSNKPILVGTRSSALAVKQAEIVIAALEKAHPDIKFVMDARLTAGDRDKVTPLPNLGKGLWTSEFEARLVAGELDLVVHSAKDMPTALPEGCAAAGFTAREDPRDAVIFPPGSTYKTIADLPKGSVVGTSSVRRSAQLKRRYPGLQFRDLRGNIDTRLRKLDVPGPGPDGTLAKYDCIILAAAGLERMDQGGRISQLLDAASSGTLYAVGQGALGLEIRADDDKMLGLLKTAVIDNTSSLAVLAERAVMRSLEGGCSVPIGVETSWDGKKLRLQATTVSLDGTTAVDGDETAEVDTEAEAEALGTKTADAMIKAGAQKILDAINANREPKPPITA